MVDSNRGQGLSFKFLVNNLFSDSSSLQSETHVQLYMYVKHQQTTCTNVVTPHYMASSVTSDEPNPVL